MDNFKLKAISLKLNEKGVVDILNINNSETPKYIMLFEHNDFMFCHCLNLQNIGFECTSESDRYNLQLFINNLNYSKTTINGLFTQSHYNGFLKSIVSNASFAKFIYDQISYLPMFCNTQDIIGHLSESEISAIIKDLKEKKYSNLEIYTFILSSLKIPFKIDDFNINKDQYE